MQGPGTRCVHLMGQQIHYAKSIGAGRRCQEAIDQVFVNDREHRDLILSFEQKDLLATLVATLKPFSTLTDLLSGDTMVTASSLMPTFQHKDHV